MLRGRDGPRADHERRGAGDEAAAQAAGRALRRVRSRPPTRSPFPWESPPDPIEVAHEVFQAWLTFAVFDNARRGAPRHRPRRVPRRDRRDARADDADRGAQSARLVPRRAHRAPRSSRRAPDNRMVGYPYTKYMVSVMDVDMAGALVRRDARARRRARHPARPARVPARLVLRARSGARRRASRPRDARRRWRPRRRGAARRRASASTTSRYLDLYSCFASSLHFACDALGLAAGDPRGLTVTGGLPYHGGPASGYLTHSIAAMVEQLRADPDATGLVSGVGMHMTKHVFGVVLGDAGAGRAARRRRACRPRSIAAGRAEVVAEHDGDADGRARIRSCTAATAQPEWALLVCDLAGRHAHLRPSARRRRCAPPRRRPSSSDAT